MQYLLNGVRCDKLSTAVATVRVHPDKYEKDFDAVVTFFTQYINKRAPILSAKVASLTQTSPSKQQKTSITCGTFKEVFQRGVQLNVNGIVPTVV